MIDIEMIDAIEEWGLEDGKRKALEQEPILDKYKAESEDKE